MAEGAALASRAAFPVNKGTGLALPHIMQAATFRREPCATQQRPACASGGTAVAPELAGCLRGAFPGAPSAAALAIAGTRSRRGRGVGVGIASALTIVALDVAFDERGAPLGTLALLALRKAQVRPALSGLEVRPALSGLGCEGRTDRG